jgi:hypothetical protein
VGRGAVKDEPNTYFCSYFEVIEGGRSS